MLYEVVKRTMFLLPPEKIHTFVFGMIKTLHLVPALGQLASSVFNYEDDILAQDLFGVHFPAPLGLAAGFEATSIDGQLRDGDECHALVTVSYTHLTLPTILLV